MLISTHTLTWSVTGVAHKCGEYQGFQLTRSRGAWLKFCSENMHKRHFNSHAHVERDLWRWKHRTHKSYFNSHAHVERDGFALPWVRRWHSFQLTRSRGAWPAETALYFINLLISTHTLTWSVTTAAETNQPPMVISTHTLTWSVTTWQSWQLRTE